MNFIKLCMPIIVSTAMLVLNGCTTISQTQAVPTQEQLQQSQAETELAKKFAMAVEMLQNDEASEPELKQAKVLLLDVHYAQPSFPGPLVNLGAVASRLGNSEEAKNYFQQVLDLSKPVTQMRVSETESEVAISTGDGVRGDKPTPTEEAANDHSNELSVESQDALSKFQLYSLNYLGVIARQSGEFDLAERYYREALLINENDLASIRNLGILLDLYRGNLAEALALYERYQMLNNSGDPKIKDWIFDIKNRI
mgnify:CR=1 FL=1